MTFLILFDFETDVLKKFPPSEKGGNKKKTGVRIKVFFVGDLLLSLQHFS
jgi:hypothetical protein